MTDLVDVHRAARDGDVNAVEAFLRRGGEPNLLDQFDTGPLYYAVKHDNLEVARILFGAGGDIHRNSRFRGDPIGAAVWNLNRRMVEFVLGSGVNVNRLRNGETSLDLIDTLRSCHTDRMAELEDVEQLLLAHGAKRACDIV
jgi:ankyrin repeat protein